MLAWQGNLSGGKLSKGELVRGEFVRSGTCPQGHLTGGNLSGGQLSGGKLSASRLKLLYCGFEIALLLIGKVCLVNRQPPPIQFSLQQPSHSRIMSWALSPQSPDLSLEQFNISLQLLKKQKRPVCSETGPRKVAHTKSSFGLQ